MQASCRSKKTLGQDLLKTSLMQFQPLTPSLLQREIATVKAFAQLVFKDFVFKKPTQIDFNPLATESSAFLLTDAAVPSCRARFLG
jgi:hypothetical protein